jgi:omega-hydroxy-beta-dihydromenaquinone-9 sulfotransferase
MSLGINTRPPRKPALLVRAGRRVPIEKPIFVGGLGRSGTSIIHTMLSIHPHVNWLSLLCGKFPERPYLNRWLMRAIDVPILNLYLKYRFVPLENYAFWDAHFGGFFRPCRDLVDSDVSERTRRTLPKAVSQLLTLKRHRLLIKITGFPRISFLHGIFPDAKFVHVIRDGRAVANSRMNVPFWTGWQGTTKWSAGPLPEHYAQEWQKHKCSFVALAGIEWKLHMDQFERVKRDYPHIDICEVRYESFCEDPARELKRIADYCELCWPAEYEAAIRKRYVSSENEKWKKDLTEEQQESLGEVLRSYLIKYGYETCQGLASTEWRHASAR